MRTVILPNIVQNVLYGFDALLGADRHLQTGIPSLRNWAVTVSTFFRMRVTSPRRICQVRGDRRHTGADPVQFFGDRLESF